MPPHTCQAPSGEKATGIFHPRMLAQVYPPFLQDRIVTWLEYFWVLSPLPMLMTHEQRRGCLKITSAHALNLTPTPPCCHGHGMREVEVAGYPVLLVREQLQIRAMGSTCPHAGAPLCKGYLKNGRLRCPWHGSCFSTKTGDIEEYPTLDCIPVFQVTIEDGKVFVTASRKDLASIGLVKPMSRRNPVTRKMVLLLGAGPAALVCAETLRQEGFTGRIVMVTKGEHLPFDKTKLSKDMAAKAESLYLRPQSFLDTHDIEVWKEKEVVSVDLPNKTTYFGDGSSQAYDSLLIATGSDPKRLRVPGANLRNVCYLQTPEDANRILQLAFGKRVVIVGASFIGMELASSLSTKALSIHIIEKLESAYKESLGPEVGEVAMKMLHEQGVLFSLKTEVAELRGEHGKVTHVLLDDGHMLLADVVVIGIGVTPNTRFLQGSAIELDKDGSVLVDLFMRTKVPDVFAAGDAVSFPVALFDWKHAPIHHWQVAQAHGHVAALNILQRQEKLHTVPFFWTKLLECVFRYAGYGKGYKDIVVKGNMDQQRFVIFYIRDGLVTAVSSLNFDPVVVMVAEVLLSGRNISKQEAQMFPADKTDSWAGAACGGGAKGEDGPSTAPAELQ
ncbi:apoptosis-inducing factor 3-like [Sphaerodactylus townsendi]|uniref:apoptosis-inducing factor 3-like n=1 Tax=Sphaerodactylus townsendi TaxID=933632 RepID=UPI0020265EE8|nr:apoptosis-inducing factor 3-like [Sphaerodactylus townsendi]